MRTLTSRPLAHFFIVLNALLTPRESSTLTYRPLRRAAFVHDSNWAPDSEAGNATVPLHRSSAAPKDLSEPVKLTLFITGLLSRRTWSR